MTCNNEDLGRVKWIGEQALATANHHSGMRLSMTLMNFGAMGAILGYFSGTDSSVLLALLLLIYSGGIFATLTFKLSSAHRFSWNMYEHSRNVILPDDEAFRSSFSDEKSQYEALTNSKPIGWIIRVPHYWFWPITNFLIPVIPAVVLLVCNYKEIFCVA